MLVSTVFSAALACVVALPGVIGTPNPCRAGEKRDLDMIKLNMREVSDGFGPWRLFNTCIFQSNNDAVINSSISFNYVDKNRGTQMTMFCESKDHYDMAIFNNYPEAFQCGTLSSLEWNYINSKLSIYRSLFQMSLTPDNINPETGGNTVTIGGWVSTEDWEHTPTAEGLYIHRGYQEMKWDQLR